jgi:hypothetical protein
MTKVGTSTRNDRLRAINAELVNSLELLANAVEREGWPSGWALIRKDVQATLAKAKESLCR